MRIVVKFLPALLLCALGLAVVTPGFAQTARLGVLRIIQTAPDFDQADVYVGSQKVASSLKYHNLSNYSILAEGSYDIKVFPAPSDGNGAPLVDVPNFRVTPGSATTLIVWGLRQNNSLTALPLTDDNSLPTAGKAKVRFIHAVTDAPAVDITAEGFGKVFSSISFKNLGNYLEVPAQPIKLTAVTTEGNQEVLSKTVNFEAGKIYSIIAVGQVADKSLDIVLSVDNSPVQSAPAAGLGQLQAGESGLAGWLELGGLSLMLLLSTVTLRQIRRRQIS